MFGLKLTWLLTIGIVALAALALPQGRTQSRDTGTNAARLSRGLPLLSPRFSSTIPGRADRRPTPVQERRGKPSSVPTLSGNIKVTRKSNGASVGFVSKSFYSSSTKRFGVTSTASSYLAIDLTKPRSGIFEITIKNGPSGSYPFLGFASGSQGLTGSNYAALTTTAHTNANSPPANVGNSFGNFGSESTVWSIAGSQLTARWVQGNGQSPTTKLWYLPNSNALIQVSANSNGIENSYGGYEVIFTLV